MTALDKNCVKNFEAFLRQNMYNDDDFKKFKRILMEVGGIIAGGSVLAFCYGTEKPVFRTNDIDIYVNIDNYRPMMEFIFGVKLNYKTNLKARFSTYDNSYLSKNKIKSIYEYYPGGSTLVRRFKSELDIMTVRNCRKPEDVARNFDLTCCQVWYDGTNIYANYPEDVKNKTATITKDYAISYLSGNIFLQARSAKYITRGFKLKAEIPDGEFTISEEPKVPFMKFRKMNKDKVDEIYAEDSAKRRLIGKILCRIINTGKDEEGYDSEDYDNPEKLLYFGKKEVDDATNSFKKNLAKTVAKGKAENIILLNDWLYKHWL
jgi:hypothetical protein